MSIPTIQDTDHEFIEFFKLLDRIKLSKHEKNIFSLGARRHFENPISDLLAFFLNPVEEHGLGSIFLDSLVACMTRSDIADAYGPQSFSSIIREQQTEDGKFIDFVIEGAGWLLLVENKIYSGPGNPFGSYEAYAEENRRDRVLGYVLLAPSEIATPNQKWIPVSYHSLIRKVKERMSRHSWGEPISKWQVLAREFILHLETLINYHDMKQEDFRFALDHLAHIRKAKLLEIDFLNELKTQLRDTLGNVEGVRDPTAIHNFGWGDPHNWAIRCGSEAWGQSNIAIYPAIAGHSTQFYFSVYAHNLSDDQERQVNGQLSDMQNWHENGGVWSCWKTLVPCESLDATKSALQRFAKVMVGIHP